MKQLIAPFVVGLIVMAGGTYYQAILTDRFEPQTSEKLDRFTNALENVPIQIGDWHGVDTEMSETEWKATNCTGYVTRTYTHKDTQQLVSVYVVAGTARHITIHSPDWCYQAAGYVMQGKIKPHTVDCGPDMETNPEFSTASFVFEEPYAKPPLRILWSYSDTGKWEGPKYHKVHFAGRPALYKVYLTTPLRDASEPIDSSVAVQFAKEFMPVLTGSLFDSQPAEEQIAESS